MDIRCLDDAAAVAREALRQVLACVTERPDASVALPTGHTPVLLYQALAAAQRGGGTDLRRVTWFALDEFLGVGPGHPGSFRRWLMEHFVEPAGLDAGSLHVLRGDAPDPVAEAASYEARIREAGGLDLALLGLGENGHLAFNEPGTPPDSRCGVRVLSEATRRASADLFGDDPVPRQGLSMGLGTLAEARRLVLLATGPSKAAAVEALSRRDVLACPAALLRGHPAALVLLDSPAANRAPAMREAAR
ncbi:MAG: glucosamine-6-phosphate deaminase [Deltaproteobacteria bacterium]|nr:glucosamine-6-phosphate deaminase [Deltaproteobacteria bacterium]